MPKWRKLAVSTCRSYDLHDLPNDFCRLTYVLLPLALDREGRGLDNAAWLRSELFPLREDVETSQVRAAMDAMAELGLIERYEVNRRAYFWKPGFYDEQGNTRKESESELPPPPGWCAPDIGELEDDTAPDQGESESGATPEQVQTYSRPTPDLLRSNSAPDADPDPDSTADPAADVDSAAAADARASPNCAGAGYELLKSLGMTEPGLSQLAREPLARIQGFVIMAQNKAGLRNPAGWVRTQLESDAWPDPPPDPDRERKRKYGNGVQT